MRLTQRLYKGSLEYLYKRLWKQRGYVSPSPMQQKPWYLEGKEVIDPVVYPESLETQQQDQSLEVDTEESQGLNYHEDSIHEFSNKTRMLESLSQACILTKTQTLPGLPQKVKDYIGVADIPEQDELVQRYIMQAHIWDPAKEKLPKRINKAIPGWKFKAEYGIPEQRIRSILLENVLRLSQMIGGQFSDVLLHRRLVEKVHVSLQYLTHGGVPMVINGQQPFLLTSANPLAPFVSPEEVDNSVTHQLPDLTPVSPLIDLNKVHNYSDEDITIGLDSGTQRTWHPHTLYLVPSLNRRPQENNAKMLMYSFAYCAAVARRQFGVDVETLPEPISIQCVATNGQRFYFSCFQLNTLNCSSPNGVKNLAWFNNDHLLFNKILPKRAMLRNTKYEDYDPEVFKTFLGFFLSGANLENRVEMDTHQQRIMQQ